MVNTRWAPCVSLIQHCLEGSHCFWSCLPFYPWCLLPQCLAVRVRVKVTVILTTIAQGCILMIPGHTFSSWWNMSLFTLTMKFSGALLPSYFLSLISVSPAVFLLSSASLLTEECVSHRWHLFLSWGQAIGNKRIKTYSNNFVKYQGKIKKLAWNYAKKG